MKLPLWGRTEDGSMEPFPYHLLSTLSDGTLGMSFPVVSFLPGKDRYSKNVAFGKFRSHFEWNPINYPAEDTLEYRLKHQ